MAVVVAQCVVWVEVPQTLPACWSSGVTKVNPATPHGGRWPSSRTRTPPAPLHGRPALLAGVGIAPILLLGCNWHVLVSIICPKYVLHRIWLGHLRMTTIHACECSRRVCTAVPGWLGQISFSFV